MRAEITKDVLAALLDHLRLCGCLPESYRYDSSEENLYSKYTDILLAESLSEKQAAVESIVAAKEEVLTDIV